MSRRTASPFAKVTPELEERMGRLRDETISFPDEIDEPLPETGVMPSNPHDPVIESLRREVADVTAQRDEAQIRLATLLAMRSTVAQRDDGTLVVNGVLIDSDKATLIASWAESNNQTVEEMAKRQIQEAMDAYLGGG